MWETLQATKKVSPLGETTSQLVGEVLRTFIYLAGGTCLAIQVLLTFLAPDEWLSSFWFGVLFLGFTSWLALKLIPRHLFAAQLVWQTGLALLIFWATHIFGRPEITFLYPLLPFMATLTVGWPGAMAAEGLILLLTLWHTFFSPTMFLPPQYTIATLVLGAFTGIVGWVSSRALYTVVQWSLHSFNQAQKNMEEARRHRGQLAQALKDLDQAYYRLERTNAALIAAWRAASEAEQFKAKFATDLSHELRTPLNLIIGFCEMMLTAPQKYGGIQIPGPYRKDLNTVYQNARHLAALVDDVLDLARIDAGKLALEREHVDIELLIQETIGMVRNYIEAKGLELRVHIEKDLPALFIDRLRIRQVLLNLLVNAARFTEQGWIYIDASRRGQEVVISVADTGRGIPEAQLPRIFEEFRQAEPLSPAGWTGGTGLGLPISKKLIELHGGRMGVRSIYLKGSTFWFTLPCASPEEKQEAQEIKAARLVRGKPIKRLAAQKRLVIIVHDDEQIISLLQRYLGDYRILGAPSLQEGISLAKEMKAVALIADTSTQLETLPEDLILLRCTLPSSHQAAQMLGANDFIVKPVSEKELWRAIEKLNRPIQRVLIADDDIDMVRLIRRMLVPKIPPANCFEAHNGEETWKILKSHPPDLLLLDLMMPQLSGHEILARMTRDPEVANIPVIVISARDREEVEIRLPGQIYISKMRGLRLGELIRTIEANLAALAPGWH